MKKLFLPILLLFLAMGAKSSLAAEPGEFNLTELQHQMNKTKSELARLLALQKESSRIETEQLRKELGKLKIEMDRIRMEIEAGIKEMETELLKERAAGKDLPKYSFESEQLKQEMNAALKSGESQFQAESQAAKADISKSLVEMKKALQESAQLKEIVDVVLKGDLAKIKAENYSAKVEIFQSDTSIKNALSELGFVGQSVMASVKKDQARIQTENNFARLDLSEFRARITKENGDQEKLRKESFALPENKDQGNLLATSKKVSTPFSERETQKPRDTTNTTPTKPSSPIKQTSASAGTTTVASVRGESLLPAKSADKASGKETKKQDPLSPDIKASPKGTGDSPDTAPDATTRNDDAVNPVEEKMAFYASSIQDLKESLSSNSSNARSMWIALGKANLESERYLKSLKPAERYRLIHGDQYTVGSYEVAVFSLQRALALNPRDADVHYLLGETYDEMKEGLNASGHVETAKLLYRENRNYKMAGKADEYTRSLQKKYNIQQERPCNPVKTLC